MINSFVDGVGLGCGEGDVATLRLLLGTRPV